ncbi:MAG: caspase family protein, partial [Xanthobacteraceae bacterium]
MSKFPHMTVSRLMTLSWLVAAVLALTPGQRAAHAAEMRFALVIGNDEYKSAKLATPANDAGLVAEALTAAGFTVTGARNLDQATLRESFREFIGQVAAAGPDAIVVVYLAGYGVQFAGENYFVPVDADLARDVDVPLQAVRVSDFAQPLAALPGRVKLVIVDAARQNAFAQGGEPLASGLVLVDPVAGMAIAFNAAPGTVEPDEPGPYGAYATALTEMVAAGGLALDDVLTRVRLRASEVTNGAEVPWYASRIDGPFFFPERVADAPPPPDVVPLADLRDRPMRGY